MLPDLEGARKTDEHFQSPPFLILEANSLHPNGIGIVLGMPQNQFLILQSDVVSTIEPESKT